MVVILSRYAKVQFCPSKMFRTPVTPHKTNLLMSEITVRRPKSTIGEEMPLGRQSTNQILDFVGMHVLAAVCDQLPQAFPTFILQRAFTSGYREHPRSVTATHPTLFYSYCHGVP